jgi:hypothetical protein
MKNTEKIYQEAARLLDNGYPTYQEVFTMVPSFKEMQLKFIM